MTEKIRALYFRARWGLATMLLNIGAVFTGLAGINDGRSAKGVLFCNPQSREACPLVLEQITPKVSL